MSQWLWHGVAVGEDKPALHVHHEAHPKAPDERGIALVLALDEVRGILVRHPRGDRADHRLHPPYGGVPAWRVAQLLVIHGARRRCLRTLRSRRGRGRGRRHRAGACRCAVSGGCSICAATLHLRGRLVGLHSRPKRRLHGLSAPGVWSAGCKAPNAQGPEGVLHAHRGALRPTLVGRGVVPADLEGLAVANAGQRGLEVGEDVHRPASHGDDHGMVRQLQPEAEAALDDEDPAVCNGDVEPLAGVVGQLVEDAARALHKVKWYQGVQVHGLQLHVHKLPGARDAHRHLGAHGGVQPGLQ
mmetsp:Transcript_23657/g.74346  ORF Transcript_23657/g.74346 Transcript_23657/m.74346 type:complete len:300 (+) Transcript_23657:1378-2277(+)